MVYSHRAEGDPRVIYGTSIHEITQLKMSEYPASHDVYQNEVWYSE